MEVMDPRCCGLDVHKSSITACVRLAQSSKPLKHIRRFGCTTRELRELVVCLQELAVEHVAMESTGFMGSRCGTFSKATFKSCWPTHSILRQSPGARRTPRTVSGSRNFCSTDSCGAASFPRC